MIYIDEDVLNDVAQGFHIPAKPEVLTQLQHVMSKPESSSADEARVIIKDVSLSAAILKTINTPYFGLRRKVSDIEQAVCFLGRDIVNDLVAALLFRDAFDGIPSCLTLERFWDDAKDVANAMTFINKHINCALPSYLYSIGLFHDCGIPALSNKFADYKATLVTANANNENSIALEQKLYATDHAVIGYFIASSWHLPKDVCTIILNHHELDFLTLCKDNDQRLGYAALKLAENLVDNDKRKCQSPDWQHLHSKVLQVLGLNQAEYLALEEAYKELV